MRHLCTIEIQHLQTAASRAPLGTLAAPAVGTLARLECSKLNEHLTRSRLAGGSTAREANDIRPIALRPATPVLLPASKTAEKELSMVG